MQKITITPEELHDAVVMHRYTIDTKTEFQADASDLFRDNHSAALYIPGGDIGDMAIFLAAAHNYGFEIDKGALWNILMSYQSPELDHISKSPHLHEIIDNNKAFQLDDSDCRFIESLIPHKGHRVENVLNGAAILMKGQFTLPSCMEIVANTQRKNIYPFIFHYSLINKRHKDTVKKLLEENALKLFPGQDEEYLYEVISDMTDNHLFESIKRLIPTLPIYLVSFEENGNFSIETLSDSQET